MRNYLAQAKTLDKVILVTTSGFGTGKTEDFRIDTISTASKKVQVQPLAAEIVKRLDAILGRVS